MGRYPSYFFALLVIFLVGCRRAGFYSGDYMVTILETTEAVCEDGIVTVPPVIRLEITGPEQYTWQLRFIEDGETVLEADLETNTVRQFSITGITPYGEKSSCSLLMEVRRALGGDLLLSRRVEIKVENIKTPKTPGLTSLSYGREDTGFRQLSLKNQADTMKISAGEIWLLRIGYEPFDKETILKVTAKDGENICKITNITKKEKEAEVSIYAEGECSGTVSIAIKRLAESTIVDIPFTVNTNKEDPTGEELTAELFLRPIMFSDKPTNIRCELTGINYKTATKVDLSIDGKFVMSETVVYPSVDFYLEKSPARGVHVFRVDAYDAEGKIVAFTEQKAKISGFSYEWTNYDGVKRNYMRYLSESDTGTLTLSLDCEEKDILLCTVTEKRSEKKLKRISDAESLWSYIVPHFQKGNHTFTVNISTAYDDFEWELECEFRDLWTCTLGIENEKVIFYSMSGPEEYFPLTISAKAGLWLEGYIQYKNAAVVNGEHIEESNDEYTDIGYYSASIDITTGTGREQKKEVYNGKISQLITYLRSETNKIHARTNGSSRWVYQNNMYTKEYYTPDVIPGVYIIITSNTSSLKGEFIDIGFNLAEAKKYFESKNVHYRDYVY